MGLWTCTQFILILTLIKFNWEILRLVGYNQKLKSQEAFLKEIRWIIQKKVIELTWISSFRKFN